MKSKFYKLLLCTMPLASVICYGMTTQQIINKFELIHSRSHNLTSLYTEGNYNKDIRFFRESLENGIQLFTSQMYIESVNELRYYLTHHQNPPSYGVSSAYFYLALNYIKLNKHHFALDYIFKFLTLNTNYASQTIDLSKKDQARQKQIILALVNIVTNNSEASTQINLQDIYDKISHINVHPTNQSYIRFISSYISLQLHPSNLAASILADNYTNQKDDPFYHYLNGILAITDGDLASAKMNFRLASVDNSDENFQGIVLLALARAHYLAKDYKKSVTIYNQAAEIKNTMITALYEKLFPLYALNEHDVLQSQAISLLKTTTDESIQLTTTRLLAISYLQSGNIQSYEKYARQLSEKTGHIKTLLSDESTDSYLSLINIFNHSQGVIAIPKQLRFVKNALYSIESLKEELQNAKYALFRTENVISNSDPIVLFPLVNRRLQQLESLYNSFINTSLRGYLYLTNSVSSQIGDVKLTRVKILIDRIKKIENKKFFDAKFIEKSKPNNEILQLKEKSKIIKKMLMDNTHTNHLNSDTYSQKNELRNIESKILSLQLNASMFWAIPQLTKDRIELHQKTAKELIDNLEIDKSSVSLNSLINSHNKTLNTLANLAGNITDSYESRILDLNRTIANLNSRISRIEQAINGVEYNLNHYSKSVIPGAYSKLKQNINRKFALFAKWESDSLWIKSEGIYNKRQKLKENFLIEQEKINEKLFRLDMGLINP